MKTFKMDHVPHLTAIPKSLRKAFGNNCYAGQIVQTSEARIKAILNDEEQTIDIIQYCKEYSYTLPTPNIENFQKIFDYIYLKVSSGEIWEEIKEDLQEGISNA